MKRSFFSLLSLVLAVVSAAMTTGCAVALIGVGAGAATAAYVMGELSLTYESDYKGAVRASSDALGAMRIPIAEKAGDEVETVIKARQPDGTPIEISIARIEEKRTQIGVRTGYVGVWDHRTSRQIHDLIGERLALPSGKASTAAKPAPPAPEPRTEPPAPRAEVEATRKKAASKTAVQAAASSPPPLTGSAREFNPDLTIFFASGAEEALPEEVGKLDRVAAALRQSPEIVVSLHGYSDSRGKASRNFILSVGRADSVKRYLAGKGCPADRVLVIGHGAAKFLGDNGSERGRRLNRRVEIEIHNAR